MSFLAGPDAGISTPVLRFGGRRTGTERPVLSPRGVLLGVALFAAAAAISAFTILRDVDPFDEGLALQAARRVAAGEVPYRDFLWAYGPLQPYLLGALVKLFGVSLLHWRILRVLADSGVALAAYLLVRPAAPRALALAVWLAVACEMAQPRSANPFPYALLALLGALLLVESIGSAGPRRLFGAALLTALAAGFRLDFGIYGLVAVTVALALRGEVRRALSYGAVVVALSLVLYLPFLALDGPGSLYHALVGSSLSTGAAWRLPFPLRYHPAPDAGLLQNLKHGLDFYVPLLLVVGLVVCALGALADRERRSAGPLAPAVVLALGALAYLLSRADEFHAQPLFVLVAIGLGLLAARASRPLAALCVVLLALLLAHGAGNRTSALLRPPRESPIRVAVADGVRAPPREARAIERMVALVDSRVPTGLPIYVLARRSDLVRINDPLIYVLTDRYNPTPEDFGLLTGAVAQRRIVATLARVRPRVLVRWTDPTSSQREPNSRGRSSGVHTLDNWVAVHYRLLARLYHYDVLITRAGPGAPRGLPARS